MNADKLISIVIPCYNGAMHIGETLQSILSQQAVVIEIIVVDDGSTDDTKKKVEAFTDNGIKYVYQKNQGVSVARNNGFNFANGEFIVFFDADDKMEEGFLKSRLDFLVNNSLDFVSGPVKNFSEKGLMNGLFRGTSGDAINEILLYNPEVTTCPSNYLFRKDFLSKHQLKFNTTLSSTADKFFILQCAHFGKTECNISAGLLLYRVSSNSMSHSLTQKLVDDNEKYYQEIISHGLIPPPIHRKSMLAGYIILGGAYRKTGKISKAFFYTLKATFLNPIQVLKKLFS